ncbi:DEAD/DEAH box helicase [Psychrobacter sp. ER1]|uniref:DEAD/DEAH box helicase n=1 Tax=Psychrobacter sp. ER1 TaxID=3406645 RepID=UPI003B4290CF
MDEYNQGRIQVLTSKRVLDEGFNVPQTQTAYILASNTTKKQWTQRLGRVLRKDKGKNEASIHDFIVMPSMSNAVMDDDFKNLLKSEATRIQFFFNFQKMAQNKTVRSNFLVRLEIYYKEKGDNYVYFITKN